MDKDQISMEDFARAVEAAHRFRRAQPQATRFYWADQGVKEVFGGRLGIVGDAVPPRSLPLYYGLVSRVEAELWQERDSSTGGEP